MDIKLTCPLGSECEEIKDNIIHRCKWYVNVLGEHPQTGQPTNNWECAIAFTPILQVEVAQASRGVQAATESLRNEMVKGQEAFNKLMLDAGKDHHGKGGG